VAFTCKYIALFVPDVQAAESFYRDAFSMELLFRESEGEGGWHTLAPAIDWAEAGDRGVRIDMVALRRDAVVLAIFGGDPRPGTLHEICVEMAADELAGLPERLPPETPVLDSDLQSLRFEDPFGFRWAVHAPGMPFRSSGEIAGRWIG
jgi:catechol 2,3-dioxygenase-like lactoylglutathione lyase family enzyme